MLRILTAVFATAITMPALAGTQVWDFNSSTTPFDKYDFGNTITINTADNTLVVSGWADSKGTTNASDPNSETIEEGELKWYSNTLGMVNKDEASAGDEGTPNHSIDNYDPAKWGDDFEMVKLDFTYEVSLDGFNIGWARENYDSSNDRQADTSVLAYVGTGTADISGLTWDAISKDSDWVKIGNYADSDDYNYQAVNSAVNSKTWLIGAYNPLFGTGAGLDSANDGFKLASVTTSTNPPPSGEVSEPSSIAILALGALALFNSRRKKLHSA